MLPQSLEAATIRMMRPGSVAREVFGDDFVEHFGGTREHEIGLWNSAVTNWEGISKLATGYPTLVLESLTELVKQWSGTWSSRDFFRRSLEHISFRHLTLSSLRCDYRHDFARSILPALGLV